MPPLETVCNAIPCFIVKPLHNFYSPPKGGLTPEEKVKCVMEYVYKITGVHPSMYSFKSRRKEFVIPRQAVCYLSQIWGVATLGLVGQLLGGRDHTTVIHSKQRMQDLIDTGYEDVQWVKEAALKSFTDIL